MIEVFYRKNDLVIQNSDKKEIVFDTDTRDVLLDGFDVAFPWEYEKSGILLEVKEYGENLFYNFLVDGKHVLLVSIDNFELKEKILSFFWDVDLLFIVWTKDAAKIFESIEAKIVIPYGEWKDIFLNTLSQHVEEVTNYKQKWELPFDRTEFVNLGK